MLCMLGISIGVQSGQDKPVAGVFARVNIGLVKLHIQCPAST